MDTCPKHKLKLVTFTISRSSVGPILVAACPLADCDCMRCVSAPEARQMQMTLLPGLRKQTKEKWREKDVQSDFESTCERHGYWVLTTSERRKRVQCPKCGDWFTPTGGTGVDKGIPDDYVRHPVLYPPFVWLGFECKGTTTPISEDQRLFAARLGYAVGRNPYELWESLQWAESLLKPAMEEWARMRVLVLQAMQAQCDLPGFAEAKLNYVLSQRDHATAQYSALMRLYEGLGEAVS